MLAIVLWCLGGLAIDSQKLVTAPPPELPVVRLDGVRAETGTVNFSAGPLPERLSVPVSAQRPGPMPSLPATRLDERPGGAQFDGSRGVSLTFARPLPVRDVLLLLFRGTPFSVVLEPGVSGTFVGELKDLTLRQAVEAVLFPAALDYDADGAVVRVFPRRPQTRIFSVDHLHVTRAGLDFFADIGGGVQALLSATGTYHVNRKASLVQVTDFVDRLDVVAVYLETAHLRANRQVRIHVRMFEVTRPDATPIEWSALAANPRSGVRRAAEGAGWRVENFDAWLRTIGEVGSVRHVAAPMFLAMNNEPTILRADDAAAQLELRLTVTPQIAADGIIHMHVAPGYVDGRVVTAAGTVDAQFTASVDTVMRLADGDTVLIGGLLRRRDAASHAEVVVFLTATTVMPSAPLAGGGR